MTIHTTPYHSTILERKIIGKWVCQIGRDTIIPAKRPIVWRCSREYDVGAELKSPIEQAVHILNMTCLIGARFAGIADSACLPWFHGYSLTDL
jgi:hypothetical protein